MGTISQKGNNKTAYKLIILCIMPFLCSIVFRCAKLTDETDMKVLMRLALLSEVVYAAYLTYRKRMTAEKAVYLIVITGCILRIGYTLYTGALVRGHDIGRTDGVDDGHWGYMNNLVNGHLPSTNGGQYYHPPLYYIVSAALVRVMMFIKSADEFGGFEYIPQLVSCVCSVISMLTVVRIMRELKMNGYLQIIPMALMAVYPEQIMTAGRMNNDSMVQMFTLAALYFTLRWYNTDKLGDIIGMAVSIGCGMMTKISCASIAIISGSVMVYKFVKVFLSKDSTALRNIITQFTVFAVICFPLGLWYGIRNYIKFGQPLTFVMEPSRVLYRGDESFFNVWVKLPIFDFIKNPYVDYDVDKSVWTLLLKSGVHGEFTWDNLSSLLAWTIEYAHLALWILSILAVVTALRHRRRNPKQSISALSVWGWYGLSVIMFNIAYPFGCTSNFRYVLPVQISAAFLIAYMCGYLYENRAVKKYGYGLNASIFVMGIFCALSVMHFC